MNFAKKYAGYFLLLVIVVAGLGLVIWTGFEPRVIQKIKISQFENPTVVGNSLLLRMNQELKSAPVLLWGFPHTQNQDIVPVLLETIRLSQGVDLGFDKVIVDSNLAAVVPELTQISGDRLDTKIEIDRLAGLLTEAEKAGHRVLVVLPTVFAATSLVGSPAHILSQNQISLISFVVSSFPRSREDENTASIPCNVNVRDTEGTGSLGCKVLSVARMGYRKHFAPDAIVGSLSQISKLDYLLLLTREPAEIAR